MIKEVYTVKVNEDIIYDIRTIKSITEDRTALSFGRFIESGVFRKPAWKESTTF